MYFVLFTISNIYTCMVDSKLGTCIRMYSMLQKKMLQDAQGSDCEPLQMPSCREEYHKVFVVLISHKAIKCLCN